MKWFKHDTNALHDAKIEKLIMKYGIQGYGLYFACVEIIAGQLSPENFNFELEHDSEILAHKFKVDTLLVQDIIKYCVSLKLFEINSANGRIVCTKLAARLDNTMSQNPELKETLRNFKQIRLDKIRLDESRDNIEIPLSLNTKEFIQTWKDWELFRKEKKCKLTPSSINRQMKLLEKYPVRIAIQMIDRSIQNGYQGLFPPKDYRPENKKHEIKKELSKSNKLVEIMKQGFTIDEAKEKLEV